MPSLDSSIQDVSTTGMYEAFASTLKALMSTKKAALAGDESLRVLGVAKNSVTTDMKLRTASVNKSEDVVRRALGSMQKLNLTMKAPEVRKFLDASDKSTQSAIDRLSNIMQRNEKATATAVDALTAAAQTAARLAAKGAQSQGYAHSAERVLFGTEPGSRGFAASEAAKVAASKATAVAANAKVASNEIRQALKLMEHQKINGPPPLVDRALKDLHVAKKNLEIAKVYADATDGTRAEWSRTYFQIFSALKFLQGHLRMVDAFTADDTATLKILNHAEAALAKVRDAVAAADAAGANVETVLDPTGAMKEELAILDKARAAAQAAKIAKQGFGMEQVSLGLACTRRAQFADFI